MRSWRSPWWAWPRGPQARGGDVMQDTTDLAQTVREFLEASVGDWTGGPARMLATTPEIAGYSFATAVILGDADRVRQEIERDPEVATRPGPGSGWTPLHAVCASRWHHLD